MEKPEPILVKKIKTRLTKESLLHDWMLAKTTYRKTTIVTLAGCGIIAVGSIFDPTSSVFDFLIESIVWIFIAIFIGYGIQTHGMETYLEKIIEGCINTIWSFGKVFRPLERFIEYVLFKIAFFFIILPIRFFFELLPSKLPALLRPLYFTFLGLMISYGVYSLIHLDNDIRPSKYFPVTIGKYSFTLDNTAFGFAFWTFAIYEGFVVLSTIGSILNWMGTIKTKGMIRIRW